MVVKFSLVAKTKYNNYKISNLKNLDYQEESLIHVKIRKGKCYSRYVKYAKRNHFYIFPRSVIVCGWMFYLTERCGKTFKIA